MRHLLASIVVCACFFVPSSAQEINPDPGYVFDDSSVPKVEIYIDDAHLEKIFHPDSLESNTEYPATFFFTRDGVTESMEDVGFRLRGNTSRFAEKKSFKVSFNSFEPGRNFRGLEKMNLNGEHNDPSVIRSKMSWHLFNELNVVASRSNHIELYINDVYRGIYLNVEHIDEEFIQKRFDADEGNLYKCLWPADFWYRGADPDLYKRPEPWGRQAYELKTNLDENDYSDLAHFIDVLNNTSSADFECEIEEVLEVDHLLRHMAVDVIIGTSFRF